MRQKTVLSIELSLLRSYKLDKIQITSFMYIYFYTKSKTDILRDTVKDPRKPSEKLVHLQAKAIKYIMFRVKLYIVCQRNISQNRQ